MQSIHREAEKILAAIDGLVLYREIFKDPVLVGFKKMLINLDRDSLSARSLYFELLGNLIGIGHEPGPAGLDLFKNRFLSSLLGTETAFSFSCEKSPFSELDHVKVSAARRDMVLLREIYDFDLAGLQKHFAESPGAGTDTISLSNSGQQGSTKAKYPQFYHEQVQNLKSLLSSAGSWAEHLEDIHRFYHTVGSGIFGRFWAFRWNQSNGESGLTGVSKPDPIRLDDLVGCEDQIEEIVRNTRQFVQGSGANNVLLYGDRGTGKSSTVKSLIHLFGRDGLRIVEVTKHDLLSLRQVVEAVEQRALKFIIFIDDLSFEEDETEYKELKALLEGSIAKPPENVLVYATSNRRNLVREYFNDRHADEVGKQDTYQEKLSLADRFGIKLIYSTPDKQGYLQTVDALARQNDIIMDRTELHDLALRWALWHNGRSGRTARQFINDLKGRLEG